MGELKNIVLPVLRTPICNRKSGQNIDGSSSKVGGYSITGNGGLSFEREEAGTNPPKLGNHPLNKLSVK